MAREIKIGVALDTKEVEQGSEKIKRSIGSALDAAPARRFRSALGELEGTLRALAGAAAFRSIAQLGIEIDKTRSTIAALTGGVDAANKKIAELRKLAQSSPGVTVSFATDLFVQFRALGQVADKTINDLIKSIGRLNAVFSIPDVKTFSRNLIQIFKGGFELDQIKEALQSLPIFDQILQSAFGTSDNQKLKKLKNAGELTLQTFLDGFINAVNTDPRFKNVQESLGGKLQKSLDETKTRLAELGERLLRDLLPVLDKLLPVLNSVLDAFVKLPTELQAATLAFIALPTPIINTASAIGKLAASLVGLNAASAGGGLGKLLGFLGTPLGAGLGVAGLGVAGVGLSVFLARRDLEKQDRAFKQSLEFARGNRPFLDPAEEAERQAGIAALANIDKSVLNKPLRSGLFFDPTTKSFRAPRSAASTADAAALAAANKAKKAKRDRFIPDFGLGQTAQLEHEIELARIREANRAVVERRQQELEAAQRPAQLAGFNAALAERIRKQELEDIRLRQNTAAAEADALLRTGRRGLTRSGRFIDAASERGQLTAGEAELLSQGANREFANQLREVLAIKEKLLAANDPLLDDLRDEISLFDQLGTSISSTERFMRGFNSQIDTVGDAFERFGQNVSRAFTNIRDLFGGLKQAVLQFFNDLVGQSLQNLVRNTLGSLFGSLSGALGGTGRGSGGSGISGILGNIFRTPSTFPTGLAQAFAGAGGGGISAPPSISSPFTASGSFLNLRNPFSAGATTTAGAGGGVAQTGFGALFGNLGNLFKGFGFGLKPGSTTGSLAAAAPLLGLTLGAGLGGQSTLGKILGGAGGALVGIGVSAAPAGAGFLAPLFSNPITAVVGGVLLVGAIFAGRAAQRRKDEEAAGQFLGQAFQAVEQLRAGIRNDQIDGSQARSVFESQIVGPFVQQINSLKTASVRRDWVKNQVPEIRARFDALVVPEIAAQEKRRTDAARFAAIDRRLVPQFASGGIVPGIDRGSDSVRALLRPGEMVLNQTQQARIAHRAGPDVFRSAGVPGVNHTGRFATGGIAPASDQPIEIHLEAQVVIGKTDATRIVIVGGSTPQGRAVTVNNISLARTNREL